jgi:parallel beta-helix repeat protein
MGNIISHNANGIDLDQSRNNIIYHNNFNNNTLQITTSPGGINTWDNGYPNGGNYWDTYTGVDSDGDHIGDTPYIIYGGFNRDRYPLMIPYDVIPNQPPTCALSVNTSNGSNPLMVIFTMTASDPDGSISSWVLDVDNDRTPEYSASGTPASIQKHIYHKPGTYTAKFMVTDNEWATASTTKFINLNQQNNDDGDIPGFEFTLFIFLILGVLFMSKRKRQHGFK